MNNYYAWSLSDFPDSNKVVFCMTLVPIWIYGNVIFGGHGCWQTIWSWHSLIVKFAQWHATRQNQSSISTYSVDCVSLYIGKYFRRTSTLHQLYVSSCILLTLLGRLDVIGHHDPIRSPKISNYPVFYYNSPSLDLLQSETRHVSSSPNKSKHHSPCVSTFSCCVMT